MLCFRCGSHNPEGSEFCSNCGQSFTDGKRERKTPKPPPLDRKKKKLKPSEAGLLEEGTILGERYEIAGLIGVGPFGAVYRARDLEIEVDVALKAIHAKLLQEREEKKRFLSAIRNAKKITHPNLVKYYDEDEHEKQVFITMQLLEGLSLRKIIKLRRDKEQSFARKEVEPIIAHICQALDKLHENLAHGGLKPENVIILPDTLKLTDMGLLGALPRKPALAAIESAKSEAYLAPELRDDGGSVEPASDIYSLAAIVCELASGKPFTGNAPDELPEPFAGWLPVITEALDANPAVRPSSAREFFEKLTLTYEKVKVRPSTPPRPAPSRAGKKDRPESEASHIDDKQHYPPTVVDARTLEDEKPYEEESEPSTVSEEQVIEEIAGGFPSEEPEVDEQFLDDEEYDRELEEVEEFLEEDDFEEEALDEGETVVQPPVAPRLDPNAEFRVARPTSPAPGPRRKTTDMIRVAQPVGQSSAQTPPPSPPPQAQPQPVRPAHNYGAFSQPPIPPSFVSQPPAPRPIRWPVYVFLAFVLVIVGVGVYYLVDYLKAQAELARAQARLALSQKTVPAAQPQKTVSPPQQPKTTEKKVAVGEVKKTADEPSNGRESSSDALHARPGKEKAGSQSDRKEKKKESSVASAEPSTRPKKTYGPKHRRKPSPPPRKTVEKAQRPAKEQPADTFSASEPAPKSDFETAMDALSNTRLPALEEPPKVGGVASKRTEQPAKAEQARAVPEAAKVAMEKPPKPAPAAKAAASAPSPAPPTQSKKCPRGMVLIAEATAIIGSSPSDPMRNFGERNPSKVKLQSFCIDRYEYPNIRGRKPLVRVSWRRAAALCRRRGKRLCTEEEWEYACKGKGNRRFPYGSKFDANRCNTEDADGNDRNIMPAGSMPGCRSPFGIMDMSGNVSEWTSTPYAAGSGKYTYKGGSAFRPDWASRCAARSMGSPGMSKADLGFRCCADPK